MEREHPRFTSEEIDDRFLIEDLKVKPCEFGADCKHGQAKCPFLHPGEKGRRDLSRFCYSATPCLLYRLKTRSCPEGNNCPFAHGFLERRFHPSRYPHVTGCDLSDLKEYLKKEYILEERLKKEGRLHPHPADARERAAIELILDLKEGNGLIREYKTFNIRLHHAYVPVSCFNFMDNDLTMARAATDAIHRHYSWTESVTGATYAYENAFIWIKNVQPILVPGSSGCSGPQQHLFNNFNIGSNKLFLKHYKDIAVTPLEERAELLWAQPHLLSTVNAPPITGGSSVPKDPNSGRIRRPLIFDSGASVHVVGEEWMLQGYQVLAEPWPIAVADGHPLVVVGIGFISQERFIIPNVFHVQGLKMNLISVSQLDRDHGLFSGFHDGICKVLKRGGDVIGGGFLLANGLYVLSFLQVPEN